MVPGEGLRGSAQEPSELDGAKGQGKEATLTTSLWCNLLAQESTNASTSTRPAVTVLGAETGPKHAEGGSEHFDRKKDSCLKYPVMDQSSVRQDSNTWQKLHPGSLSHEALAKDKKRTEGCWRSAQGDNIRTTCTNPCFVPHTKGIQVLPPAKPLLGVHLTRQKMGLWQVLHPALKHCAQQPSSQEL